MIKRVLVAATALALIPALVGCDNEPTQQFGDLELEYVIGSGTQNCEEAGINDLEVYLIEAGGTLPAPDDFDCTPDDQTILLTDVEVGNYTIQVDGLRSNNVIYTGSTSREVTVVANQTTGPINVTLVQLRPSIGLWFDFSDPGSCASFGVVDVVVRVYENSTSLVIDQSLTCDDALDLDEPFLVDGLSSTATYDIRVRGTNDNGEYTFEYNQNGIEVEPGPAEDIDVELEQCSGLCADP